MVYVIASDTIQVLRDLLVSGGFSTRRCESEAKEEWMAEILFMRSELKEFAKAMIEEWSGRCILGQRSNILLYVFHCDQWSPACSARSKSANILWCCKGGDQLVCFICGVDATNFFIEIYVKMYTNAIADTTICRKSLPRLFKVTC